MKRISLFAARLPPVILPSLLLCASWLPAAARAGEPAERYAGPEARFDHPAGWKVERGADVSAEIALKLLPPDGARVQSATLLLGGKRLTDAEMETASADWHSAHLRNRAAWGMHLGSGLPREELRSGGRRAVRFRDRVGGALGASEQTLTCALASSRLACVLVTAPTDSRDLADALAAQIFATLSLKTKK